MAENNHQRTLALRAPRGVRVRPQRQRAGREPPFLQHLDRPRAHQGSEPHDPAAGGGARHRRGAASARSSTGIAASRSYRPITIVQDATLAQVAAVTARRLDFELPDVVVEQVPTRRYPGDDGGASVRLRRRGQRRAGRRQRRPQERRHRRPGGHREGLQRAADGRGRRQARRRQQRRPRDPHARGRAADRRQAAAADDRLRRAEGGRGRLHGVAGFNGAAVDARSAQRRRARRSRAVPAYDPNAFAAGIDRATWASLNTDELQPLQDRAIQGRYSPGSTFKMAVALGGARGRASSRPTSR